VIPLSTYIKTYRVGDIVDIKANGAVQKGVSDGVVSQRGNGILMGADAVQGLPWQDGRCLQRDQISGRRHHLQGKMAPVQHSGAPQAERQSQRVGNRYIEKRVNVRVEHVSLSRSREEFLNRVKSNAEKRREAKEKGESVQLKRQPVGPREARTVELTEIESITPQAYDTHI